MNIKLFDNVRVVDPSRGLDAMGHLVIGDDKILSCGEGEAPAELVRGDHVECHDATGKTLVPGFFDLRSHFREPGFEDSETIASGSAAAAAGGYTDVLVMPNTRPCADTPGAILLVLDRGAKAGLCRLHPAAAITKGLKGEEMVEYGDLYDAGAVAFSDDLNWVRDSGLMRHSMECARALGVPVISHPEDESLTRKGVMHEGSWSTRLGLAGLPAAAEVSAVSRDIELARLTGAHLHLPHVSCEASVHLIRAAKEQGVKVTAETTPHHLWFSDRDCRDYDTHFKMKPPLRTPEDQAALIAALADGTLDLIASDHAPHTITDKERTFSHAPFGVIGLETAFAAAHDRLVAKGSMSLLRLVELMSLAPARILGLPGGSLEAGGSASFALIDTEQNWVPQAAGLLSRGRNCPWLGKSLSGRVVATYLDGRCSFELSPAAVEDAGAA